MSSALCSGLYVNITATVDYEQDYKILSGNRRMSSINMTTQVTSTTTIQDQRRRLCVQNEITNDLYYGIVRTKEQRTTGEDEKPQAVISLSAIRNPASSS